MVLFLRKSSLDFILPYYNHHIYEMLSASANRVPTSRVQTPVLLTRHKLICYNIYMCVLAATNPTFLCTVRKIDG
jgi:hypothetical protein